MDGAFPSQRGQVFDARADAARQAAGRGFKGTAENAKTKLCTRWISGDCRFGDRCNFAHGEQELRNLPPRDEADIRGGYGDRGGYGPRGGGFGGRGPPGYGGGRGRGYDDYYGGGPPGGPPGGGPHGGGHPGGGHPGGGPPPGAYGGGGGYGGYGGGYPPGGGGGYPASGGGGGGYSAGGYGGGPPGPAQGYNGGGGYGPGSYQQEYPPMRPDVARPPPGMSEDAWVAQGCPVQGPNGWVMYRNKEDGDVYYHQHATGVTQWDRPADWPAA